MSSPFAAVLASLTRQRGVRASLVVDENDGIVVDSNLPRDGRVPPGWEQIGNTRYFMHRLRTE